jgi:hypothetical protein
MTTTIEFITALFCQVDEQIGAIPKHPALNFAYMDPPRFARTISCDSSQDHDCTHIYGLFCGRHGSPGLDGLRALPPQQFGDLGRSLR